MVRICVEGVNEQYGYVELQSINYRSVFRRSYRYYYRHLKGFVSDILT